MRTVWIPIALITGFLIGLAAQPRAGAVLMDADRAFDRLTAEKGAEGWASFFAPDGKMVRPNGEIVEGREAIRKLMEPMFSTAGNSLRWQPDMGELASSADLGYTSGASLSTYKDAAGVRMQRRGRYLTVWRKQPAGGWKVAIDIGVSGEPKKAEGN